MRKGSDAKTVPGSVRCRPSTRMSFSTKGSTAQAIPAWNIPVTARASKPRRKGRRFAPELKEEDMGTGSSVSARIAGDVIGKGQGQHQHQDQEASRLEFLLPPVGDGAAAQALEKIIHEVPAIEHGQGQQVQH